MLMRFSGLVFGFSSLSSTLWSLLGSLWQEAWQEAAERLAALCRCGRCGGPRRWSFSAGARAGPPVSRSARHASMLLALPDGGRRGSRAGTVSLTRSLTSGALMVRALAAAWRDSLLKNKKRWDDDRLLWSLVFR